MFAKSLLLPLLALSSLSSLVAAGSDSLSGSSSPAHAARHVHRSHAHAVRSQLSAQSPAGKKRRDGTSTSSPKSKKKRCVAKQTGTATSLAGATATATSSAHKSSSTSDSGSGSGSGSSNSTGTSGPAGGIITVQEARCGDNGAIAKTTVDAGPNGSEAWLNCGVTTSGGWDPPTLTMDDIVYVPLDTAMENKDSPFQECSKYISIFKSAAATYNIPDTLLAAFAQQESSCDPSQRGGGGEAGMFQLSDDKCPGGSFTEACLDPTTNTNIAAKYISDQLKSYDNNLLTMIGEYNGWNLKMTVADAEKAKDSSCCRCQNNLDYLHQFMNGWLQDIDAYSVKMGTYNNLASCPNQGANGRRQVSRIEREAASSIRRKIDLMGTPPNRWRF